MADAAQQQPPRHRLVTQSKEEVQVSPGLTVRHAPFEDAHDEQPRAAEELEQQLPPRHAAEAQVELTAQEEPGEEREALAMHVESDVAPE